MMYDRFLKLGPPRYGLPLKLDVPAVYLRCLPVHPPIFSPFCDGPISPLALGADYAAAREAATREWDDVWADGEGDHHNDGGGDGGPGVFLPRFVCD